MEHVAGSAGFAGMMDADVASGRRRKGDHAQQWRPTRFPNFAVRTQSNFRGLETMSETTVGPMKGRLGAYLGATIGCLGWMIGFTVVCLTTGNADVWAQFAFMGFAISLAMAGIVVVTLELALRTFGRGGLFQLILWAELTFFGGVITLLLNHWIAPILESSPSMIETLNKLGGSYKTSDLLPTLCMATSVVLFAVVIVHLGKYGKDEVE
jgi:hypothetical protein